MVNREYLCLKKIVCVLLDDIVYVCLYFIKPDCQRLICRLVAKCAPANTLSLSEHFPAFHRQTISL